MSGLSDSDSNSDSESIRHWVFLSYAHEDKAWVDNFKGVFESMLRQRCSIHIGIWRDTERLAIGAKIPPHVESAINEADAFVAILSPPYYESEYCRWERGVFIKKKEVRAQNRRRGDQIVDEARIERFIKIEKLPYDGANLLTEILAVRFYQNDDRDTPIEFPFKSEEFNRALAFTVQSLCKALKQLRLSTTGVYVGAGPEDTGHYRRGLESELASYGFSVWPEFKIDRNFPENQKLAQIKPCDVAVFLLGTQHDVFVMEQIKLAIRERKFCKVWVKFEAGTEQRYATQQRQLIEVELPALARQPETKDFLEIVKNQPITLFSEGLKEWLGVINANSQVGTAPNEVVIYLLFEPSFEAEQSLAKRVRAIISVWDGTLIVEGPNSDQKEHEGYLETCDAVVVLRSASDEKWLDATLADLKKASLRIDNPFIAEVLIVSSERHLNNPDPSVVGKKIRIKADKFQDKDLDEFKGVVAEAVGKKRAGGGGLANAAGS